MAIAVMLSLCPPATATHTASPSSVVCHTRTLPSLEQEANTPSSFGCLASDNTVSVWPRSSRQLKSLLRYRRSSGLLVATTRNSTGLTGTSSPPALGDLTGVWWTNSVDRMWSLFPHNYKNEKKVQHTTKWHEYKCSIE